MKRPQTDLVVGAELPRRISAPAARRTTRTVQRRKDAQCVSSGGPPRNFVEPANLTTEYNG